MGYIAVLFGLSAFLFCIQGSYGTDVALDSYAITAPAAPADIEYNRVTDTIITFTATVSSASTGGQIAGIDVYFADTNDDEIVGTKTAAGGGTFPAAITTGTPQALAGNTATLKFATEAACTAATQLCVQITGTGVAAGTDVQCLAIGTSTDPAGAKDCAATVFKAGSFMVSAPATYKLTRVAATTLTFDAGLINVDASAVTITSYKLYLSDNEDLADSGTKVSAAIDVTGAPTTLPASADGTAGKGLTTGMTASVKILSGADCSAYNKMCLKMEPGSLTICIDVTGKTDCAATMAFKPGTFQITEPETYKLSTTAATTLTFDAGLINADASAVTITSYKLHLSDNEDLAADGAKVSAAIDVTDAPATVPASADGTAGKGLTTGMTASVTILSETDCSAYNKMCLKMEPGPLTICIDVTGKTECPPEENGSVALQLNLFTTLSILLSMLLLLQG